MIKYEYILCAAIHFQDGLKYEHQPLNVTNGIVICGRKHCDIFVVTKSEGSRKGQLQVQGFVTNKNRFVDRQEAKIIAFNAGQIDSLAGNPDLFSEDLY